MPRWLKRYGHAQLLAALGLLLFVNPFLEGLYGGFVVELLLWVTFAAAIVACSVRRWHLVVGIMLMALVAGIGAYRQYFQSDVLSLPYAALGLAFSAFLAFLVLLDVLSGGTVDRNKIFGALSAYLFLGITWAFAFTLLEGLLPGSFAGLEATEGGNPSFRYYPFIGFSLVTITTLGYGNVTPLTPRADALCTAEALVGQIYLTVLVARLVALSIRPEPGPEAEEREP